MSTTVKPGGFKSGLAPSGADGFQGKGDLLLGRNTLRLDMLERLEYKLIEGRK